MKLADAIGNDGEGGNRGKDFLFGTPGEAAEGGDADGAAKGDQASDEGQDGDSSEDQPAELSLDGPGGDGEGGDKPPPFHTHPAWKRVQGNLKDVRRENAKLAEGKSKDAARIRELDQNLKAVRELYPDAGDDLIDQIQEDQDAIEELNRLIDAGDPEALKLGQKILDGVGRGRRGRGRGRTRARSASPQEGTPGVEDERVADRKERAEDLLDDLFTKNRVSRFRSQIKKGVLGSLDYGARPTRESVLDAVNSFLKDEGLTKSDIIGRRVKRATVPSGGSGAAARGGSADGGQGGKDKGGEDGDGQRHKPAKSAAEAQQNRSRRMTDLLRQATGRGGART